MKDLHIACVSDIHIGNKRNTAPEIISNLRKAFPDNAETAMLDIIFLAGDVFDDLLTLNDNDLATIDLWICSLLHLCAKHDIVLRVLAGTGSHDWSQSERFITINEIAKTNTDVKFVKDLSIEYIDRFGINVLYVPDEWESSTDKTLDQVKSLLSAKGLSKVDYAIMHGQFHYQLPPVVKAPKHNEEEYLALVKELIFIGHVHKFSRYDRIIAQGSFDRLNHGEEEPKGHVRATVSKNSNREIAFVENTTAKKFITIDCTYLSLDETISKIDNNVNALPDASFVRVMGDSSNPIFSNMEMLIRRYPLLLFSKLIKDTDEETVELIETDDVFIPITITPDNIVSLLLARLSNVCVKEDILDLSKNLLEEVK